jgi:predicted nucleic acid-binding protein
MSDLVVDSCCVINLFAAGNLSSLLPSLGVRLHVPTKVKEESLFIRRRDPDDARKLVRQEVDLAPALAAGLFQTCDLQGPAESNLFVQLATTLDDGEAVCLALAKNRGWGLATDDRRARREAVAIGVPVVSTAELVQTWADNTKASEADVAQVLRNIQDFAQFVPHRSIPLHSWWLDVIRK